jgi:hypothetical protein
MDFLKKHIEKLVLIVLLALLAGSVMATLQQRSGFQSTRGLMLVEPDIEFSRELDDLDNMIARLTDRPVTVSVEEDNRFTPDVRVVCINPNDRTLIPEKYEICPYCGWEQKRGIDDKMDFDKDGIPDIQERDWGMDPQDPTDALLDRDGDGFSVLYEFQQGTDPLDPNSHPALIDYLRLSDVEETSINFELRGTARVGGNYTLQLNWRYPGETRGTTSYIRVGNHFGRNNEFFAESFTEKFTIDDRGYRIDESLALISSGRYKVELERDGDARRGQMTESAADLELIMGPEWRKTVRVDQSFELDNKTYIVVDIQREFVVINLQDSEQARRIRKTSAEELEELEAVVPSEGEGSVDMEGMEFDVSPDMM